MIVEIIISSSEFDVKIWALNVQPWANKVGVNVHFLNKL